MKPKEQVGIGQRALTQIRNKSKRTLVRMGRVEYSELSADDKRLHNAQASALGATAMFSSTAALKEIESKVVDRPLQIGQTLDMFPKA